MTLEEERDIVEYIGTIWEFIQDMDEDEIRELVLEDADQMDDDLKAYTLEHLDDIVQEAVKEVESERDESECDA